MKKPPTTTLTSVTSDHELADKVRDHVRGYRPARIMAAIMLGMAVTMAGKQELESGRYSRTTDRTHARLRLVGAYNRLWQNFMTREECAIVNTRTY